MVNAPYIISSFQSYLILKYRKVILVSFYFSFADMTDFILSFG